MVYIYAAWPIAGLTWLLFGPFRIVAGFEEHPDKRWKDGLWFYYVASAAEFLTRVQKTSVTASLITKQRPDGAWANREPLVKEDDPLIATALALRALHASA